MSFLASYHLYASFFRDYASQTKKMEKMSGTFEKILIMVPYPMVHCIVTNSNSYCVGKHSFQLSQPKECLSWHSYASFFKILLRRPRKQKSLDAKKSYAICINRNSYCNQDRKCTQKDKSEYGFFSFYRKRAVSINQRKQKICIF